MASKRYAGRIASRVARKTFRGTRRMSKYRIRKAYATKVGQYNYRLARRKRFRPRYNRYRRYRRNRRRFYRRRY